MEKLVKESLNEEFERQSLYSQSLSVIKEIQKYCKTTIKECQDFFDEVEEEIQLEADDDIAMANNEGRMDVCEEILRIIGKK